MEKMNPEQLGPEKFNPEAEILKLIDELAPKNGLGEITKSFLLKMKEYDYKTFLHECRVALIAKKLAEFSNKEDTRPEFFGGANHDVGKLEVDNSILNVKGNLSDEQYEQIKTHAEGGFKALSDFLFISYIAGSHHSYQKISYGVKPEDLNNIGEEAGERVKRASENVALADSFDAAMTRKTVSRQGEGGADKKEAMIKAYPDWKDKIEFLFSDPQIQKIVQSG